MRKILFLALVSIFVFSLVLSQDTKENAEFKLAINLYNEGFYDLAISQLKKFIDTYPNSPQTPEAQFYLGMSYFKLRKFEDAQTILQDFALSKPSHPKAPEALWKSAECFIELKKYKEAGSAFERIKLFYPKSQLASKALVESAKYFELANDLQNTKKVLLALIQEYPESEHFHLARFKLAEILTKEGNYEKALIEYRKISNEVEDKNLKFKALLNIAKINSELGKSEEAERQLLQITSQSGLNPEITASAHFELGKIQSEFGEYENAINYMLKAQSIISNANITEEIRNLKQKITLQLANYYFNIADYQNAIKHYTELLNNLSESETNPEFYFNIAIAFDKILNYQKANEFYIKVINSDTTSVRKSTALLNLATNFARIGEFAKAVEFYKKHIELFPTSTSTPYVIFQLALLYEEKLNDYKRAIFYYTDLLNRFPQNRYADEAIYHIGLCYMKLGDATDAISSFETLIKNYSSSELYDDALNKIEMLKRFQITDQSEHIASIAEIIGDILNNKPKNETLLKLADLYNFKLKDYSNALKYYNLALSAGNFEPKVMWYINYQVANCAYNLFLENKIKTDSAVSIIQKFLNFKPQIEPEKADTAILYLYKVLTYNSNQEEKKKIAEDFKNKYQNSRFYTFFIIEILNFHFANQNWNEIIKISSDNFNRFNQNQIPEVLYKRAYAYYKTGEKQKSLSDINLLIQRYSPSPYDARALDLRAQIYKELKNYAEAINVLREIEKNYFYTDIAKDVKLKIADVYFETSDYLKSISEYKNYISITEYPEFERKPEVLFKIASAYHKIGDFTNAKKYYKLYISTPKPTPGITLQAMLPLAGEAYYALGNIYKTEGLNEKAVYYLEKVGKFNASLGRKTLLESADLLFDEEKYEDALKKYNDALKNADNENDKIKIQSRIIICYFRMNDIDNANKSINLFKQTFSKFDIKNYLAEFQIELGGYYFRNRNFGNAKKTFDEVIKNYPNSNFAHLAQYWLAKIEEYNGNIESATKIMLELNRKPLDIDTRLRVNLSLGNIYFKLEKYDSATIYYRFVVDNAVKPQVLQSAMSNLLACYEELGYYELAIELARKYIEKFPNADDVMDKRIKIGVMYQMLGNYDLALSYFQKLLEEADKNLEAELHYYIGEALYYKGDYEQAILEFLKVPYLVTKKTKIDWTANAFYMAGQSYEKMRKYDQAINMYQQIIDRPGIDPIFKAGAQKEIERVRSLLKQ
ncbi:MAG: tetratricopeptide repeat protein [Candidatus Kryptonium sp.]|nr:tetratricopeptide repeat protein [Candidatus Kryptonium sp.]